MGLSSSHATQQLQMQHSEGENGGPAMMQVCKFCQRNVKQSNVPRHRENCAKAPKPCVYCDEQIHPVDMPLHIQHCSLNPDNVPTGFSSQCNAEAAAATAAAHPDPVDQSSDNSAFYFEHNSHVGGTPAWFQYLASGDWLSAFVNMEESLTFRRMEEENRYALFTPALVSLDQYSCVQDFLERPSPVQPLECLLAALFVRAFLPRNVFSRTQEVTWTRALQYLPHFLASRLSEEAVAYLCTYPVFLEEIGSPPVNGNRKCTTECQPRPNPEPLTITEETASRTTVNALQGEKKAETGTSESVLREQAAAPALLDQPCSKRPPLHGSRCGQRGRRSQATGFDRRKEPVRTSGCGPSNAAATGRIARRVAGVASRRRRILGQARRFRRHGKVSIFKIVLVFQCVERTRRYFYVTSSNTRVRACSYRSIQEERSSEGRPSG
ncbi:uncharacterized protein [Dermacentor albipictus]|uniref:uncharacterized protein isoform X5 n=1 Tax=Dermacentor albipictus TaxID=60249 RepID=UPI0038FCE253